MSRRASLHLDWQRGNVRDLRASYERACRITPKDPHEWRVIDVGNRRIRVLVHNAGLRGDRAIFYFHGGGWIVGSPATHADISEALAGSTGLPVISVDYRLAPEHKAQAAIDDGLAVLDHFLEADFQSVILSGDSAGGALALAVERDATSLRRKILGVTSFYGCFGLAANPNLHGEAHSSDGLDAGSVRRYWLAVTASCGQSPYSIPALAFAAGCPVHLLIAGRDPLRDDSIALARALEQKGRSVTVDFHNFETHSFLQDRHRRHAREFAYGRLSRWIAGLPPVP